MINSIRVALLWDKYCKLNFVVDLKHGFTWLVSLYNTQKKFAQHIKNLIMLKKAHFLLFTGDRGWLGEWKPKQQERAHLSQGSFKYDKNTSDYNTKQLLYHFL